MPKWSLSDPKNGPKSPQNDLAFVPFWSQNGPIWPQAASPFYRFTFTWSFVENSNLRSLTPLQWFHNNNALLFCCKNHVFFGHPRFFYVKKKPIFFTFFRMFFFQHPGIFLIPRPIYIYSLYIGYIGYKGKNKKSSKNSNFFEKFQVFPGFLMSLIF